MTRLGDARGFLQTEVGGLGPLDFLFLSPSGQPLHSLEVARTEEGGLEVRVPGRPAAAPELPVKVRTRLRDHGFASEDAADPRKPWVCGASDAAAAVALVEKVLVEVFAESEDLALDLIHGSHRAEHEARQKLATVREHVEKVLIGMLGEPPERDMDGDFVLAIDDVHVTVAPRVGPGGVVVVRVFSITNVGVAVAPELGLFLARLNFGLIFGRFALDAEHRSIWFDETLLGDHFTDEELRFVIQAVAGTADEWDDRLKQMFGGATYQETLDGRAGDSAPPPTKPGAGGYL